VAVKGQMVTVKARAGALGRFARDNLIDLTTVGVALYTVIRGEVAGFTGKDVPFILSVVVGLLALHSVDGFIERQVRLRDITATVRHTGSSADQAAKDLALLRDEVEVVRLSVKGLRLGASATQLLLDDVDIPHDRMMHARKIYWCGVTLRSRLRQRLTDLGIALAHGADIRILIVDPSKVRLKDELTFREGVKYEYIDAVLKSTLLNLQLLAENLPDGGWYQLGLHRVLPAYGLLILDPDDPDGVCYVEPYHPDRRRQSFVVVHATTDAAWFQFFTEQFDTMMSQAELYRIISPTDVERAAERGAPDGL
jgi:hypothetical protein